MAGIVLPLLAVLAIALAAREAPAQEVCGQEGDPCTVKLGSYRVALPEGKIPAGGWPALIFYHGAGGSGARTLANTGMVEGFLARGYAVIAPDGKRRPGSRFGPGWSFNPHWERQRDEMAFTRQLLDDAAARYDINRDRVLMSGFSVGGSLVWYLACEDPTVARAFAPVAGAFWRPIPAAQDCAGPVKLLQTHGWRDKTVPLEGRPLHGSEVYQGDVFESLAILRELNGCDKLRADSFIVGERFWRRKWTSCAPGTALEFALHAGGHSVPKGWAELAMDWFERLDAPG